MTLDGGFVLQGTRKFPAQTRDQDLVKSRMESSGG